MAARWTQGACPSLACTNGPRRPSCPLPGFCILHGLVLGLCDHSRIVAASMEEQAMSDLKTRFEQAAQDVQQLPKRPENDVLLRLYALYKQGTAGDVSGARPGILDMTGRVKYDAWAKIKGLGGDEAMTQYVELVEQLKAGG